LDGSVLLTCEHTFVNAKGRLRIDGRLERTRDAVERLRATGLTQAEIARELGLTKGTVAYHFRMLGSAPDVRFSRRYDWEAIQVAYDEGLSYSECAARFGFNSATWYQAVARGDVKPRPRAMPLEHLLVADRPQTNRSHLKLRLLAAGLKGQPLRALWAHGMGRQATEHAASPHQRPGQRQPAREHPLLVSELSRADRDLGRPQRAPAQARRQVRLVARQRCASLPGSGRCAETRGRGFAHARSLSVEPSGGAGITLGSG
jgi:AraC-like DNA-binding protein